MASNPEKSKAKSTSRSSPTRASTAKAKTARTEPKTAASASRSVPATGATASKLIDQRIRELSGWRGETLARMRALILAADPEMIEEWKWMGTPVWSRDGIVCTGESYAKVVKLTFAKGASLADPSRLFNSSLEGNTRRAIDIHEGETVDARAFQALVKAAVASNTSSTKTHTKPKTTALAKPNARAKTSAKAAKVQSTASDAKPVKLLSGGNPQIAKADGDAPVQAYLAALPGWKRDVGRRLDALIVRTVPDVRKAVKWNSPLYGIEGQGWFLGLHAFTHYVRVTLFRGTSLRPLPPGPSKTKDTRYVDVREGELDEAQMAAWIRQAAALPGWTP